MIEKSDSKWISLAAASILGQAPRYYGQVLSHSIYPYQMDLLANG
ncbi:MAG: hypothetical protein V3V31_14995 [Methylococcales bacterium]